MGNITRIAVELGLHHNPIENTGGNDNVMYYTPAQSQLRLRLWYIVLQYDTTTSLVFGRPLTIQPADYNTPLPTRLLTNDKGEEYEVFSEAFEHSLGLIDVSSALVNSAFRPGKLNGDEIVTRAIEVERIMDVWRRNLPDSYQNLLARTLSGLSRQDKIAMMSNVKLDVAIVVLHFNLMRMYNLRTVFYSSILERPMRQKALADGEYSTVCQL